MPETHTGARPIALITGASAGIGAAFARSLAARRYDLVLVARDRKRLEDAATRLRATYGIGTEVLAVDLTEADQRAQVEARLAAAPPVDLLVNNAGFGLGRRFAEAAVDDEERMVRIHVLAPMRAARAALPGMIARGRGTIINVASLAALAPSPRNATYAAGKAFLIALTESLAVELAGTGVLVQALCPGFTHTEFHGRAGMSTARIPRWLWLDADAVAEASLAGLGRGGVIVVPGLLNRVLAWAMSVLPRRLVRWGAQRLTWGRSE